MLMYPVIKYAVKRLMDECNFNKEDAVNTAIGSISHFIVASDNKATFQEWITNVNEMVCTIQKEPST